jgi:hypothetical protein
MTLTIREIGYDAIGFKAMTAQGAASKRGDRKSGLQHWAHCVPMGLDDYRSF